MMGEGAHLCVAPLVHCQFAIHQTFGFNISVFADFQFMVQSYCVRQLLPTAPAGLVMSQLCCLPLLQMY